MAAAPAPPMPAPAERIRRTMALSWWPPMPPLRAPGWCVGSQEARACAARRADAAARGKLLLL